MVQKYVSRKNISSIQPKTPSKSTVDFLLAYSKSISFEKNRFINEVRFDKN